MKYNIAQSVFLLFLMSVIGGDVWAHTTHTHTNGFMAGISHPVLGLDHLLAMVAVGVVSARMGGKAIWSIPLTFVLAMLLGGVTGGYFPDIPFIEYGIVLSVIILGLVITIGKNILQLIAMASVALFGLFHGYAHGTEMPDMADPMLYGAGFVCGTIGLHLLGVTLAVGADKIPRGGEIIRFTGAAMSATGVYFLTLLMV